MKILLTGSNGQVGFELQRSLSILGDVKAIDQIDCDLSDLKSLKRYVADFRPKVIVNPAAFTAVDKAESEPELARAINTEAPRIIGQEAAKIGALVVHYSTDYVFDGAKSEAYCEDDDTCPINIYGLTKRDGEVALAEACKNHLVLRTSWVVGAHGQNFARTMLRLAEERDSLKVVSDQWGVPTSAALLADTTAHLVRQWLQSREGGFAYGTYHIAPEGKTNWCEYARFVVAEMQAKGKVLRLGPEDIIPIATHEYLTPARRPHNSQLNTSKLQSTFGLNLPDWKVGLRHILQQF